MLGEPALASVKDRKRYNGLVMDYKGAKKKWDERYAEVKNGEVNAVRLGDAMLSLCKAEKSILTMGWGIILHEN